MKKIVNKKGDVIKTRTPKKRTNKPVKLPDNLTVLKQPNIITLMNYDYKTLQMRVFISLIEKLQSSIEDCINSKRPEQLSLFQEDKDKIAIPIALKDFGLTPDNYPELKKALKQLATIPVELDTIDPITGADSWSVTGLFRAYIPKEKHARQITIEIEKDVAKMLVNVDRGYTKFLKEIAYATQSKYTIRLYMLISSWKDKGGFSITLEKFRKWLKLENKYARYKDLYRRVIKPVYDELFENADCWFEIAEVYKEGSSEPYKLNFKVIKSRLSEKEAQKLELQKKNFGMLFARHFKMNNEQIQRVLNQVTLTNCSVVNAKTIELNEYISTNYNKIQSIPNYCTKAFLELLEQIPEELA